MFENGKLDSRQATLPEHLERPTIADIVPGSAYFIDYDAIWVDKDRKVWIAADAPLKTYEDEVFTTNFVRIISFDQGLVLDMTPASDENGELRQIIPNEFEEHIESLDFNSFKYEPCIHVVTSKKDLGEVKKKFKQMYGVKLNGKITKKYLNEMDKEKGKAKPEKNKNKSIVQ